MWSSLRLFAVAASCTCCLLACAVEAPPSSSSVPEAPDVAHITCRADGSTHLATPDVLAQRDGVHIVVRSQLDEPASINGLGFDVNPGRSTWVAGQAGMLGVACWPFSEHGTRPPPTSRLTVLDPQGWWVDGELQCTDHDDGAALDIELVGSAEGSDERSISLDEARALIPGLASDDELILPGWAGSSHDVVVVVREGRRIATVGFDFVDGAWVQRGGEVCGGQIMTP